MKNHRLRVVVGLAVVAIAVGLGSVAHADLSPPNVESCAKLPNGAKCFDRGVVAGHCVEDASPTFEYPQRHCRVDAVPTASAVASPAPSGSAAPGPHPSASTGVLPPAPSSTCAVGLPHSSESSGTAWIAALWLVLAARRNARSRS